MTYDKAELVALDKKYVWHHLTQHFISFYCVNYSIFC